jgi:prepilin-type N-terminal cleavage/methylation domain-containing protein
MQTRAESHGFTLIEVLVAVTLMILIMMPLMRSFSEGLALRNRSNALTRATLLAQSALERLPELPLAGGGDSFDRDDGPFHISTVIEPYGADEGDERLQVIPYEVRVTVSWPDRARKRSISLQSVRLRPRLTPAAP